MQRLEYCLNDILLHLNGFFWPSTQDIHTIFCCLINTSSSHNCPRHKQGIKQRVFFNRKDFEIFPSAMFKCLLIQRSRILYSPWVFLFFCTCFHVSETPTSSYEICFDCLYISGLFLRRELMI